MYSKTTQKTIALICRYIDMRTSNLTQHRVSDEETWSWRPTINAEDYILVFGSPL